MKTTEKAHNILVSSAPSRILLYFFLKEKKAIFFLIALALFAGLATSIDSILIKQVIDYATGLVYDPSKGQIAFMDLMFWPLIFCAWWEVLNILWRIYDYVYLNTLPKIKQNIVNEFFAEIQSYQYTYFKDQDTGLIPGRIMEAARSIEMIYAIVVEQIARKIIGIISALVIIYTVNIKLFCIFGVWILLFVIGSSLCAKKAAHYSSEYSKSKIKLNAIISNSLLNIFNVKIFAGATKEVRFLSRHSKVMQGRDMRMQCFMVKLRYALGISCSFLVLVMMYISLDLKYHGIITVGHLALIINLCMAVGDDIWELMQEMGDAIEEFGSFKQACNVLASAQSKHHKMLLQQNNAEPSNDPISNIDNNQNKLEVTEGKIEFVNVFFGYDKHHTIIKNQSVNIRSKEKVALVGYSGSGKSTFASLLSKLYNIQSGDILIDGQSIYSVSKESLRSNISFISQEPILFERTIFENIAYGVAQANLSQVIKAAKEAHIHERISSLREGYNSVYGARNVSLSTGEKQRLIIARAILKKAPIIILDEATSALDNVTETLVQASLDRLMQDKTALIIAHRLHTLTHVDRILVFHKGNIVEQGTHQQLIDMKGHYYDLWTSQFKG